MDTAHRPTGRTRLAGLALGLATLPVLAACSSGGTGAADRQVPAEVTVTSTTAAPVASTISSATSSSPATPVATPTGATTGGRTEPPGKDQTASGLPTCQPSQMSIRVEAAVGGGTAGGQVLDLLAGNTGTSVCVTHGYPGVSLVAPGTGRQLGAPADRVAAVPATLVRLEPGKTAVARIKVAVASNFPPSCGPTQAAGFRVYLPGTRVAAYAPYAVAACAAPSVHQLQVQPFSS